MDKKYCKCDAHKTSEDCFREYNDFEILRDEFEICEMRLTEAYDKWANNCQFKALKILLIRLRRKPLHTDWTEFKRIFEQDLDYFTNALNARMLVSVLETYADFADYPVKNNALLATQLSTADRWMQSINIIISDTKKKPKPQTNIQHTIYDGFISILFDEDDAIRIFFNRMVSVLELTPIIYDMWVKLIEKMFQCDSSILSIINTEAKWDVKAEVLNIIRK